MLLVHRYETQASGCWSSPDTRGGATHCVARLHQSLVPYTYITPYNIWIHHFSWMDTALRVNNKTDSSQIQRVRNTLTQFHLWFPPLNDRQHLLTCLAPQSSSRSSASWARSSRSSPRRERRSLSACWTRASLSCSAWPRTAASLSRKSCSRSLSGHRAARQHRRLTGQSRTST